MLQSDYFEELESAVMNAPDYKTLYVVMNSVFLRSLNEFTRGIRLPLSGPYAKTDFLLKERKAPKWLSLAINDTRTYFKKRYDKSETDLKNHYQQDLRNLCEFLALLTGETIPAALVAHFPEKQTAQKKTDRIGEYVRVIVVRWDDDYAYCHSATTGDEELKVCFSHGNQFYNFDRSYLKQLFYEGAQFNLIRPEKRNNILYPELWIFEPDYLVDISAVANCFGPYDDSAMVNLMKRIEKKETSAAILLGNMASQLLDETIHQLSSTNSYTDSAKEFFANYAMKIIATEDFNSQDFHKQARAQKVNIEHAVLQTLPQSIAGFDSKNGIVEPSFFSEMLGLQGRMDYLQLDQKVLIEQKSGKGEFPYDNFIVPRAKIDNTIQLLLYMAVLRYNYRKQYEANNHELHPFLLYSKYSESLIDVHFTPQWLFQALKIRNEMAWNDIVRFRNEGYSLLTTLTPALLKKKQMTDKFWLQYIYPQLSNLLTPIKTCSDLERLYCLRMLKFVGEEHVVSKLGNRDKETSGFASTWQLSLEEKEQCGAILTGLTLDMPDKLRGQRIEEVRFEMENLEARYITNLRVSDAVVLHPYDPNGEPDLRTTMVIRGSLKSMDKDSVTIRLRAPQSDSRIFDYFQGKKWALEADFMESSFGTAYSSVYSFLSAPQHRRDLLLLQRPPKVDTNRTLKGDYGDFNELSLRVKQAQELFLIIGPPGTGKTSFGMLNTLKEELLEPNSRVLLMSYTNRAVDEMCSKLMESGIDFLRIGSELSCDKACLDHHINIVSRSCSNVYELIHTIENHRVIAGTVHAFNGQLQYLSKHHFSLAIVDEASQLLESHLLGLLSCKSVDNVSTIDKFVLIGDHKQLPAVVQQAAESSQVTEQELQQILLTDCRQSLFERLLKQYSNDKQVVYMLNRHGRMHPAIADFPNQVFYDGKLQTVPLPHQESNLPNETDGTGSMDRMLRTQRLAFVSVAGPECARSDKSNTKEAALIANMLEHIYHIEGADFDTATTVGVIVPYRNQIATIRAVLSERNIQELTDVTIDTVERLQGSQRKYIIYGFTVQKRYQLNFLTANVFKDFDGTIVDRKLNVAMTRAQEHLILVGNPKVICQTPIFNQLVSYIKDHNGFYDEGEIL